VPLYTGFNSTVGTNALKAVRDQILIANDIQLGIMAFELNGTNVISSPIYLSLPIT
jgi:hypothetical protein